MVPSDAPEDEIVPDPSEALEFEPIKRVKAKRRGLWLFLLLVLIVVGVGAGWQFYGGQLMRGENDDLPVIRAAEGPVKVRPKTPGGMAVPDRDKLVYDRMKGGAPEPRIERLLPPPEMPKTPPVPVAVAKASPEPKPKPETKVADAPAVPELARKPKKLEPEKSVLKKPLPKKIAPVVEEVKKTTPAVVVNNDVIPKPVAKPVTPKASPAVSSLAYQIQIAAVRTYERAQSEWARLKKKHGDLLGGYSLNIVRVDLGAEKGVFFRLRAGPIAGEDVAQALCQNLSKRKVGCLIVRPGG